MHLSGQLSDWSMADLLQIAQVTKKTASLDIKGDNSGRVHFRNGRVVGAELVAEGGTYRSVELDGVSEIIYVLASTSEGAFAMGPAEGIEAEGFDSEAVSESVKALQELESEVAEAGLIDAPRIGLATDLDGDLAIGRDDWAILANLVPQFSFAGLEHRLGRGGAVRAVHTLHQLGILRLTVELDEVVADEAAEGAWLDKLATQVAAPREGAWFESGDQDEITVDTEEPGTVELEPVSAPVEAPEPAERTVKGVVASASTTLTGGVYDDIRRLRSRTTGER